MKLEILTSGSLISILANILRFAIGIAGVVAFVYVIVGGYQYVTSEGDPAAVEKGRKTLTFAIVGLIIIAVAFVFMTYVNENIVNGGTPSSPATSNTTGP